MAPKNERFEMRMDEEILARVDEWRSRQEGLPSRAEAMRRLIEDGLAMSRADAVRFSDGERLILAVLADMYRQLKLKGETDPKFLMDALTGGHLWALKWELSGIFHGHEDSPRAVSFVTDVLDMWSFIEEGYAKLSKAEKARVEKDAAPFGKHVAFRGFDGNNESELMSIARFFPDSLDRFTIFKGRDLNSHAPMSPAYRRMLRLFEPMRRTLVGGGLNADQIITLLKAMSHPE